jgi:hypothetical protein
LKTHLKKHFPQSGMQTIVVSAAFDEGGNRLTGGGRLKEAGPPFRLLCETGRYTVNRCTPRWDPGKKGPLLTPRMLRKRSSRPLWDHPSEHTVFDKPLCTTWPRLRTKEYLWPQSAEANCPPIWIQGPEHGSHRLGILHARATAGTRQSCN